MKSKTASEQQTERTARPPSAGARVSTRAVRARKLPKAVLYSRFLTVPRYSTGLRFLTVQYRVSLTVPGTVQYSYCVGIPTVHCTLYYM